MRYLDYEKVWDVKAGATAADDAVLILKVLNKQLINFKEQRLISLLFFFLPLQNVLYYNIKRVVYRITINLEGDYIMKLKLEAINQIKEICS